MPLHPDTLAKVWKQYLEAETITPSIAGPTYAAMAEVEQIAKDRRQRMLDAATGRMLGVAPKVLEAMVTRSLKDGRDSQRAGERILEQVGIFKRQTELGEVERIDLVAARIFYRAQPELQSRQVGIVTDTEAEPARHNESSANQP